MKRRTIAMAVLAAGLLGVSVHGVHQALAPQPVIVAFGDSLTAGLGLPEQESFPSQLEQALRERGQDVKVINAGVSGDTASGGLGRLDWSVPTGTDAVIVELGANDALRGLDPALTKTALDEILSKLAARHIAVLLAGMRAPPNMGADYARAFDAIYPALASTHPVVFYPFFLDGVAADPKFFILRYRFSLYVYWSSAFLVYIETQKSEYLKSDCSKFYARRKRFFLEKG